MRLDWLLTGGLSCWLGTPLLSGAANGFIVNKCSPGLNLTSRSCSTPHRGLPSPSPPMLRQQRQLDSFCGGSRRCRFARFKCLKNDSCCRVYGSLPKTVRLTEETKTGGEKIEILSFKLRSCTWQSPLQAYPIIKEGERGKKRREKWLTTLSRLLTPPYLAFFPPSAES